MIFNLFLISSLDNAYPLVSVKKRPVLHIFRTIIQAFN